MNFEDVLVQVGDYGKFQKWLVVLFLMPTQAINILYDYLFMMSTPDHWCNVPQLANLSYANQSQLIRPWTESQGLPAKDHCRMYDLNYDWVARNLSLNTKIDSIPTMPCNNGWTYDQSVFSETATTKFNFVCDKSHLTSIMLTLGPIGIVIATPIISSLSDRIGRKLSFLLVVCIFAFSTLSPIVFRDYISFGIARFIGGGMQGVYFQIPYVVAMEAVGPAHRSKLSCLSAVSYALGGCILPWVAYLTGNWVWFSVFQLAVTLPYIIGMKYLPESAPWLITQNRYKEAHQVLAKIAKINGKSLPRDMLFQIQKVGEKQAEEKQAVDSDSIWDLFRVPELFKSFVILTLVFMANAIAYVGLAMNTLNFHGSEFMNYFLVALVDIPALFLGWYLIEGRLGRRWTNSLFLIICGVSLCIPAIIPPTNKTLITIMSLSGKFGTAASYMIIYQQAAELYPTTLRNEGIGISTTISAATGIFVPFIANLGQIKIWIPMFIMGSLCFVVGILVTFLPETLNEYLPQNVAEAKLFGKNTKYFSLAKMK